LRRRQPASRLMLRSGVKSQDVGISIPLVLFLCSILLLFSLPPSCLTEAFTSLPVVSVNTTLYYPAGNGSACLVDRSVMFAMNRALTELKAAEGNQSLMARWTAPVEEGGAGETNYRLAIDCGLDTAQFPWPPVVNGSRLQKALERKSLKLASFVLPQEEAEPPVIRTAIDIARAEAATIGRHYIGEPLGIEVIKYSSEAETLAELNSGNVDLTLPWFAKGGLIGERTSPEGMMGRTVAFDSGCDAAINQYIVSVSRLKSWKTFDDLQQAGAELKMVTAYSGRYSMLSAIFPLAEIVFDPHVNEKSEFVAFLAGNITGILGDKSRIRSTTGIPSGFLDLLFEEVNTGILVPITAFYPAPGHLCP